MKRSLLVTTALLLTTSFVAPLNAQTADTGLSGEREVAQQPASNSSANAARVLYAYFQAIADQNYQAAYNLHSPEYRAQVPYDVFVQMYQDHIQSISIQSVEPLPHFSNPNHQEFRVAFNVSYIKPFPAGNGRIPEFFVLVPQADDQAPWLIDGMAPGP